MTSYDRGCHPFFHFFLLFDGIVLIYPLDFLPDYNLLMKEQRKLAAIMFTDITGYSALMSKDEKHAMDIW